MPTSSSKIENAIIGTCLILGLVTFGLVAVGFSYPAIGFENTYVGPFALSVLVIWAYAAYWALDIRKALSAYVFRNQALGIGLVALAWLTFNGYNAVPNTGTAGTTLGTGGIALLTIAVMVTFYWVDASIRAAQRTDPLLRNTFRWNAVRLFVLPLFVGINALVIASTVFPILTILDGLLGVVLLGIVIIVTGVAFALSVSRSGDRTIRRHLKWFGFGLLAFIGIAGVIPPLAALFGLNFDNVSNGAQALGYTAFSYCVYRSAKSLAPLEQFTVTPQGPGGN